VGEGVLCLEVGVLPEDSGDEPIILDSAVESATEADLPDLFDVF